MMENNEQIDDEVELLSDSVESLVGDKSLAGHEASKELSMAIALKNSARKPQLSPTMDQRVEGLLLARLKKGTEPQKLSFWQIFFGTSLVGALALASFFVILKPFSSNEVQVQTLAQVQTFEPLSEAEVLLGALPETYQVDGLSAYDLRQKIHEVNAIYAQTDLTLDPDAAIFPHVQLRSSALEVIALQTEIQEETSSMLLAQVDFQSDLADFSEKVSGWPTTNEGVAYETHEKAVQTFMQNLEDWNRDMEALSALLLTERSR